MSDLASFVPPPSSQAPRAFGLRMSMPPGIAHNYTPLTPVAFLLRAALVCPNALAVIHAERGVQYTYAQWAARCLSLTFALLKTPGFAPGARVAVISPNNPMILEAHNAILAAGGIINPLNIRNSPAEIAYVLGHSGATIILCDSEYANLLPKDLRKDIVVVISNDSGGRDPRDPYEAYLAGGRREWEAQERASKQGLLGWELITHIADENAPAALCYTSGTTGKPKGVITTHRGSFLGAVSNAFEAGLGPTSVYAALLPYFHACGWTFPWAVTAAFATAYTMRKVDNDAIWDALLNAGVTHYAGAPTVQIGIVNHPKAKKLPRIVRVAVAASAPTAQLLGMMESLNLVPVHVYGLTETYGPVTRRYTEPSWAAMSTEERARLMARQGHGYLTSDEARVCRVPPEGADPQATPLEDVARDGKEMGEIMLRGNMVMKEYYNDKEATHKTFRDGWFCTGDLAVRMPGGELMILDRGKDVIISGGENISSLMVESEMATHPAVLECCVVGRKHEKWAEVGHAFVVLKQGQSADMETLKAHCRERMSKFAVPMYFDFVKELPKTSTGKVQKNVLRARVADAPQAKL